MDKMNVIIYGLICFLFRNSPTMYNARRPRPVKHPPCILDQIIIETGKIHKILLLCSSLDFSRVYSQITKNKNVKRKMETIKYLDLEDKTFLYYYIYICVIMS